MTTESDRELLGLAAKASGLINPMPALGCGIVHGGGMYWNPLTDDGDALRLAVKLHINITCAENFSGAKPFYGGKGFDFPTFDGPDEATRRAVVCAAAEIARATHKEQT